jgi:hypothetical protein
MNSKERSGPNPWIAIVISITALGFSVGSFGVAFSNFYYTQLYKSEALYALLLIYGKSANDLIADVVVVNRGNQNIVVSELRFVFPYETDGGAVKKALKVDADEPLYPFLIEPRQVKHLRARHPLAGIPREGQPSKLVEGDVERPVILTFITIGSSVEVQSVDMMLGDIAFRNGDFVGWNRRKFETVQVRK